VLNSSLNLAYFRQVLSPFGLLENSALLLTDTWESSGLKHEKLFDMLGQVDVLINISGRLEQREFLEKIPIRVYLDLDPAFTQLWQVAHGIDMHLGGHTHFATVGHAIGRPECSIPTCGLDWITMNQPAVLEHWPQADEILYPGLTTIANWRGYGSAEYQGIFYGQKAHSLRHFMDLPRRCPEPFILALGIHPDEKQDLAALQQNGWQLLDPMTVAQTPSNYQHFVQGSKAEFGIAKSGYVTSKCGWFSDRSTCYLASGRPVIAQETGFSRYLPTGDGLFTFETADDVVAAVRDLNSDYAYHARAARRIAEEYFDSDKVLSGLLQQVGAV
jgi:hypothetical protein